MTVLPIARTGTDQIAAAGMASPVLFGLMLAAAGGGGGGGGGFSNPSPKPAKRTPEEKAAEVAVCKDQKTEATNFANNMFQSNMEVCAAASSSWYGYLHQQWLKMGWTIFFGNSSGDCASVNNQAYYEVQLIIDKRYKSCFDNAMRD